MTNGDKRDPHQRSSTDESLRSERRKTDLELATRAEAVRAVATDVVSEAREKADHVLSDARDLEDRNSPEQSRELVAHRSTARAKEDAVLQEERTEADATARSERQRRNLALAGLLAFEREDTDLRLEIERERVDQALTSREDFMAMVSHDLRSLLGGIALSAELLRNVEHTDQPFVKVNRYADSIQRFSARMNRLVGDLMDIASIEAGKLAMVRVRHNASALVRDSLEAFEPAAAAQGIELATKQDDTAALVELDHERILQVLTNLVGNALKFTPRGGRITISIDRRGEEVCYSVADTGCGISADLLDTVFTRYYQANAGDRRGLGLGLFIAKSIVDGHGGRIWVESTPGDGCTVRFTLPLHRAEVSLQTAAPAS
jgi:signal transduction histidine kinase